MYRKNMLKAVPALLILMLTLALAACGGAPESAPQSGAPSVGSPAPQTPKLSGKVVVYTAGPKGLAEDIQKAFETQTGVKVEMFQGTTGNILGRLEAEKANPVADIVVLASWPSAEDFKKQGLTQAYPGAKNADKLHAGWVDADRHYFGYSASALGITYNTRLVPNPPKDLGDFADPQFRNQVNIPDPLLSGSALDFVAAYINARGDAGWELLGSLKQNGVALAGANQAALDPVITGAKSAVLAGVDYMAYEAKAKGEPVDMFYPAGGTVINMRPAFILKTAPNVDNARAFIDFLLSDDSQKLVEDAYLLPGRSDYNVTKRPGVKDIPLLDYDWAWMADNQKSVSDKFVNLFK